MDDLNKILIRRQIQQDINDFFGAKISIDERAFQVLELSSNTNSAPNSRHILSSALLSYPALYEKIEGIGICVKKGFLSKVAPINTPFVIGGWQATMKSCFSIDVNTGELSSSGYRVKSAKRLTIEDLILGPIEAEAISEKYFDVCRQTLWIMSRPEEIQRYQEKYEDPLFSDSEKRVKFYSKLSNSLQTILLLDNSAGHQQFSMEWDGEEIRFRPFGVHGSYKLQESPLPDGSLWVARSNLLQPLTIFSEQSIDELEFLINKNALERDYQEFFDKNPEYILALGDYIAIHPQVVLTKDDGSRLIPDFFLEKINSDFCDICDLKRPSMQLARYQKNRLRFRDAVMEAVAQLEHYRDWFEDRCNRNLFYNRYGLHAYRPKVVAIIGRRCNYYDEIDRIKLESRLPAHFVLKTYDDIVDKAKQWKTLTCLYQQSFPENFGLKDMVNKL